MNPAPRGTRQKIWVGVTSILMDPTRHWLSWSKRECDGNDACEPWHSMLTSHTDNWTNRRGRITTVRLTQFKWFELEHSDHSHWPTVQCAHIAQCAKNDHVNVATQRTVHTLVCKKSLECTSAMVTHRPVCALSAFAAGDSS